jgi:sugar/nucleoside kinase (ribokinase family)
MVMPGWRPDDLATLFREAKGQGLMTALDVAIAAGTPASLVGVEPALPYTDLFLPNDDESRALTGRHDPSDQAEVLSRPNPDCTIAITLGRRGIFVRSHGRTFRVGAYPIKAIDESGAGDAFAAGFITGMLEQWPLEQTIRFASAVGGSCTRALGCTEGVFRFQEAWSSSQPIKSRSRPKTRRAVARPIRDRDRRMVGIGRRNGGRRLGRFSPCRS